MPLTVYYVIRSHVSSDQRALIIAGVFPAVWVALQWLRSRRLDPIGAIVLFGFIAGVAASELLGGSAFVLKVRDSAVTAMFGVACLLSLLAPRPLMFHIGKAMSAGGDPRLRAAYDALWEVGGARRVYAILTICWGVGMIAEAGVRVAMAVILPTGPFLAVSPVLAFVVFGGLFVFTLRYTAWARRHRASELAEPGVELPSVVD